MPGFGAVGSAPPIGKSDAATPRHRDRKFNNLYRGLAQLVARRVWDAEVAGSSPVTPTIVIITTLTFYQIGDKMILYG